MSSRIVLITGGSRGLGKSMAMHLAEQGRDIILTYHSRQNDADAVVAAIGQTGQKAVALQLDIARAETFAGFAAQLKVVLQEKWQRTHFDFLINNAGSGVFQDFMSTSEADFNRMVNEHIKAPFFFEPDIVAVDQ